jgi:hypothetical protein
MKRLLVLLAGLGLAGCQSTTNYPVESPYYNILRGSELVLNKPIEIPPTQATVRLQFGKVVTGVNDFEPSCVFELTTVKDSSQRVEPDVFVITKERKGTSIVRSAVSRDGFVKVGIGGDGEGSPRFFNKIELFLHSDKQSNVLVLTCQHAWESTSDYAYQRPLTVAEMQQALGDYFTFKLAGSPK